MLEVVAQRYVKNEMESQTYKVTVIIRSHDRLTPRTALAALDVAFGNVIGGGDVWDYEAGYGYRVYQGGRTIRKLYEDND